MSDRARCDNCDAFDWPPLTECSEVWPEPHTHPRSVADLSPVACSLRLCAKCVRRLRRNLSTAAQTGSNQQPQEDQP